MPEPHQGPLVNLARDPQDVYRLRENSLNFLRNNPQILGKEGIYSMRMQSILADDDVKEKVSKKVSNRFKTISKEEKNEYITIQQQF